MTTWTPETLAERVWTPTYPGEVKFGVVDANKVIPYLPPRSSADSDASYQVIDLSENVTGGRQPYAFSIQSSTFPGSTQIEPRGRLLTVFGGEGTLGVYAAVIRVEDANGQTVFFTVTTKNVDGDLTLSGLTAGRMPDATEGVPYAFQLVAAGGVPPITFRFRGLNLGALGFFFDQTSGLMLGMYNGSLGDSIDNTVLFEGYNARTNPAGDHPPDDELGGLWSLLSA